MKKRNHISLLFCLAAVLAMSQQQTVYTNFLLNPYLYNPAYAGIDEGTRFSVSHRNQWLGFDGAPVTNIVSGYSKLKKKPLMAVGGMVISEKIGLLQRTLFYGTYSYHLKINKNTAMNFGLGVGGVQHRVRAYDARPYDKDDAFLSNQVLNGFAFDANAGAHLYTKNFFFGVSNQHMPNAKILWKNSLGRLTSHFYLYTGYNYFIDSKKEWSVQPTLLVRTNSPAPYQLEFVLRGMYKEMFWIGAGYRQGSSASAMFGCDINKQFMLGYAYDFTTTELNKYSSGSHEILLSYLLPLKKKKSKSELVQDADEEELNKIDNSLKTNLRNKKRKHSENEKQNESGEKQQQEQGQQNENVQPQDEQQNEKQNETGERKEQVVPESKESTETQKPLEDPKTPNNTDNKETPKSNEEPK
jgi:type IX secretion system PorP/SprF family membrane protein